MTMTTLRIDNNATVTDLQRNFNKEYSYLKVEFFRHQHETKKASPKSDQIDSKDLLINYLANGNSNTIDISEDRTVAMVEKDFWEKLGLSAQIFRKSGNLWIETSLTDDWTLSRQNYEGFQLSADAIKHKSLDDRIEENRIDNE
ncbi:hypothetical protein Solca_1473 [Solitalea canadensis DSM 3403]|uniref:Uncharacterized protein n=2 Tax=Solitalea canadensis TaxID=995 RepID=H8KQD6_SOLCM|nr:hypothetical protein Solca_1473 [Solitalea canadensis DSM 3403]